jgi:hypothetical protein
VSEETSPDDGQGHDHPIELLSVELVGEDELHIAMGPADLFDDPAVWGEVLANVARQVAQFLQQREARDPDATLKAIAGKFNEELLGGESGASE